MEGFAIFELIRRLWKRKLWVLVPMLLGLAIGGVALNMIPPIYRANTIVMLEPQKVPSEYVRTTITGRLQDRLKTIEQQVMSRANLQQVIAELDLIQKLPGIRGESQAVHLMRRDLKVSVQRGRVFRIFFQGRDPELVAAVANRIAELFIENNLKQRESQAATTTSFLEGELMAIADQLEKQELKVSRFRIQNSGSVPEQREANLAAISQLEAQLRSNEDQRETVEMQVLLLETQARDYTGEVDAPAARVVRLQELNRQLDDSRSRYTEEHPEVIRLRNQIAALLGQETEVASEPVAEFSGVDPMVQAQIQSRRLELTAMQRERENFLEDMAKYQVRLERTPRVEQELIRLTRDFENLRKSYQSLRGKQLEARLAENLERQQQSEQFKILQPAEPPAKPYYPNTLVTLGFALIIGGGVGLGLAFVREEMSQTFEDVKSVQQAFPGVAFVTFIPRLTVEGEVVESDFRHEDRESA